MGHLILVALSALVFVSCSNGGSSNNSPAPSIPKDIVLEKTIADALTPAQIEYIKQINEESKATPSLSLYLTNADETYEERQDRLKRQDKLNETGKKLLKKITFDCTIQVASDHNSHKDFAADGSPRVGSGVVNTTAGLVSGDECAVDGTSKTEMTAIYKEVSDSRAVAELTGSFKKSSKYKIATAVTENVVQMNMNGTLIATKSNTKTKALTEILADLTMSGYEEIPKYGTIKYSGTGKYLTREDATQDFSKMVLNIKAVTPAVTFYVDIQITRNKGQKTFEAYLNGQALTKEQLEELFSFDLDSSLPK